MYAYNMRAFGVALLGVAMLASAQGYMLEEDTSGEVNITTASRYWYLGHQNSGGKLYDEYVWPVSPVKRDTARGYFYYDNRYSNGDIIDLTLESNLNSRQECVDWFNTNPNAQGLKDALYDPSPQYEPYIVVAYGNFNGDSTNECAFALLGNDANTTQSPFSDPTKLPNVNLYPYNAVYGKANQASWNFAGNIANVYGSSDVGAYAIGAPPTCGSHNCTNGVPITGADTTECTNNVCTNAQCCDVLMCDTHTCTAGVNKTNHAAIFCDATNGVNECTNEKCCDITYCDSHTCTAGEDKSNKASIVCDVTDGVSVCTNDQCCDITYCNSFTCDSPQLYKNNYGTIDCPGNDCDSSTCCENDAGYLLGLGEPLDGTTQILGNLHASFTSTQKNACKDAYSTCKINMEAGGAYASWVISASQIGATANSDAGCIAAFNATASTDPLKTIMNDHTGTPPYEPYIWVKFASLNSVPSCFFGFIAGESGVSPLANTDISTYPQLASGVKTGGENWFLKTEIFRPKAYYIVPASSGGRCINSLEERILGTKCGCDDDCADNNVCLDNTCVDSSYSNTTAATTNILDTDPILSSNDYNASTVPTVDVAAVFSGVSDAVQKQNLRRNLVKQLKNKGGSAASLGIKVALADLNLDAGVGKSFIETLMADRGASQITIRPPKDKSAHTLGDTDTAACTAADFTELDEDVIECTHTEDGDVCLRCDSGALVSKTVFNADTNDYSVYCHDGSVWGTAATKSAGETYTCSLNDKTYESAIFSETGGGGSTAVCVEVGQRVLMSDGTHKNVEQLVPGDVLRTPEGITTVRSTRRGGRHLSQVHDVECAGQKGSITGNHAYHCEGEWRLAQETHEPRALTGTTEVVAVETDNYCEDRMILESGLHVETWDGRGINEWRPHSFENGRRLRCTLKGSWRDQVLQRMDSKQ